MDELIERLLKLEDLCQQFLGPAGKCGSHILEITVSPHAWHDLVMHMGTRRPWISPTHLDESRTIEIWNQHGSLKIKPGY